MARIGGVDLPRNKRGAIALTYIYGIGRTTALNILAQAGVDEHAKVETWSDDNIREISRIVSTEFKTKETSREDNASNFK
jgi:small subunit ribosomal protein S13